MVSAKGILYNFFTSGKDTKEVKRVGDIEMRYMVLNFSAIACAIVLLTFALTYYLVEGFAPRTMLDFSLAVLCFLAIVFFRTKIPYQIPGNIIILAYIGLCGFFLYYGELSGFAALWLYAVPLSAIFSLGVRNGSFLCLVTLCMILFITLVPDFAEFYYSPLMASRLAGSFVLVTVLTIAYEMARIVKERSIAELNAQVHIEHEEVVAMKSSLTIGVFLMDKDLVIQSNYSTPLERILGTDNIAGRKITDFFDRSMSKRELDAHIKYFDMVISRSFDEKLLKEVNPISEFAYVPENSPRSEEKILHTSFVSIDRGDRGVMILGTMEDVTEKVRLQKELAEEARKHDEEMAALYQIVQLEPGDFENFINYTEKELKAANQILKNYDASTSADELMNAIFRRIHAIKSNAIIHGVHSFGNKLHELELEIRRTQNRGKVSFDDVLHMAIKLETIMDEKDKYKKTIERITDFRKSHDLPVSGKSILVNNLIKVCENSGQTEGKEVTFVSDDFDESIFDDDSLVLVQEILTQLVRNAVAHGIESPDERKKRGKNPTGKIYLSVKQEENQIHMMLVDDGAGIDFEKVKEKAKKLDRVPGDISDRNTLIKLLFAPGFSTVDDANMTAGQGIGLDLVRDRVKELRGAIKVVSKTGKGTVFNLAFPFKKAEHKKAG